MLPKDALAIHPTLESLSPCIYRHIAMNASTFASQIAVDSLKTNLQEYFAIKMHTDCADMIDFKLQVQELPLPHNPRRPHLGTARTMGCAEARRYPA